LLFGITLCLGEYMKSLKKSIDIVGRTISKNERPYIIAELSGNHNGDIQRAFTIMEAAKQAGADAIKLQTFTADTITIDHNSADFVIDLPPWKNRTLYDLYQQAHTPWEWHEELFNKGKKIGLTVFSSPFDNTAIEFLESLNPPVYKVASPELVDIPLIENMAATGKPMIISTGMATIEEIEDAVNAAQRGGCDKIILLHCVSSYPTPYDQVNLLNIPELEKRFNLPVGLSDHTLGTAVSVAATALGAVVIEKHLTMSRSEGGVDSTFSIEPAELKKLVNETTIVAQASHGPFFGPKKSEKGALKYRRSLYAVEDIQKNEPFTNINIRSIRPAYGLPPKHLKEILSKTANYLVKRGEPLNWSMINN
jgi:pseudaminic acid synthase